ncbi:VOC family protein [candidate division CSSED10-310 bacterium]|uniref:VOC family protein n=1 Tax=candidate division CSSED10-310 bacterium TaxID=2855610 RepID=A0ABV6YW34_UNCC1
MLIDHIAIVVKKIRDARDHYEGFLNFHPVTEIITDQIQKVKVQFLANEAGERIELIEPLDDSSPSMNALKKGGGVNHICYRCSHLESIVETARMKKIRMVCPPVPGAGLGGCRVAFFVVPAIGLVEFVEYEKT